MKIEQKGKLKVIAITVVATLVVALGIVWSFGTFGYTNAQEIPYNCEALCFVGDGQSTPVVPNSEVLHNTTGVRIINKSTSRWECDLIAVSGHFAKPVNIEPGKEANIAYRDFTLRNVRLDPGSIKPDTLSLQCTIDGTNHASKYQL